jgi:hypothetical protein
LKGVIREYMFNDSDLDMPRILMISRLIIGICEYYKNDLPVSQIINDFMLSLQTLVNTQANQGQPQLPNPNT